ncbi:MAG TPA: sigma-70 family RNA polymerase sigma factor [Thermoanaerobaculia bacterium]|nr:sigma-70 family RNA polymerase sigma factor [Thermoanaerobaculia bacterium]
MIERVVRFAASRQRLSAVETEDLGSLVRLRLIENNYAILERWEGRSSLATYLTTVVQRLILDERNKQWGKWRPSAEARRLGVVACELERLTARDGLTLHEAHSSLAARFPDLRSEDVRSLSLRLPRREGRKTVPETEAEEVAGSRTPEDVAGWREALHEARRIGEALEQARKNLDTQDRLILRMRYDDGFSIADIASALSLPAKPLYKRMESLLRTLQAALASAGFDAVGVRRVLEMDVFADAAPAPGEERPTGPSPSEGASSRERSDLHG